MPTRPPIIKTRRQAKKQPAEDRPSPHARGYTAKWRKIRERIIQRDQGECQACGRVCGRTKEAHIDHIKAKAAGGTDHDNNLQLLCRNCHSAKTARERADGTVGRAAGC